MHVADAEARDLVVRVGHDLRPRRKHAHVQPVHVVGAVGLEGLPLLGGHVAHALQDQLARLGVKHQLGAERRGGALPRVVVGGGADAAAGEHQVPAGEGVAQHGRDALAVVAHVTRPRQLQAARGQQLDDLGQVLVLALSGEDLVADDDQTDVHVEAGPAIAAGGSGGKGGGTGTASPSRRWCSADSR